MVFMSKDEEGKQATAKQVTEREEQIMKYFRVHTADLAYITKQPRGIFTAIGKLVDANILTREETKEYWKNREYFERVLPVPPFYDQGNPDGAITWFKDTEAGNRIYDEMVFYREMASKYGLKLYMSECSELPGEIVYEDEYQIAVKTPESEITIVTKELNTITWPDYQNSIANLPNSILKKFGMKTVGDTLPLLNQYLEKDYKNIVVILLDGMGVNILEKNLDKDGFFRTHLVGAYSSTFPPTTVAATTSIMSGLAPCEHGWLGWDCYYPQVDKNVTVFLNTEQGTEIPAADYNVPWKYTGYESIFDRFEEAGLEAHAVTPFVAPFPDSFEKILRQVEELCQNPGEKYIYAYWNEPDHIMHEAGCFSEVSKQMVRTLQEQVAALCKRLKDTLVIVTADHGHMDSKGVSITDYPSLMECLVRLPSVEPRALNLFIKEGKEKQFETEFKRLFGEKFMLLTKQEVIDRKLFGIGKEHPCFQSMLGDYLAIAVDDLSIYNTVEEAEQFIGVHAGLTEDEMRIPLIVFDTNV